MFGGAAGAMAGSAIATMLLGLAPYTSLFLVCQVVAPDRKSTRLNSSHTVISYAVFCLKKQKKSNTHRSSISHHYTYHRQSSHMCCYSL